MTDLLLYVLYRPYFDLSLVETAYTLYNVE